MLLVRVAIVLFPVVIIEIAVFELAVVYSSSFAAGKNIWFFCLTLWGLFFYPKTQVCINIKVQYEDQLFIYFPVNRI